MEGHLENRTSSPRSAEATVGRTETAMRVHIVVDLTDAERKALAAHYGRSGLATRKMFRNWAGSLIDSAMGDLEDEFEIEQKSRREDSHPAGVRT